MGAQMRRISAKKERGLPSRSCGMRERRAVAGDSLPIFETRPHSRIVSLRLIFCMGANYWQWAHDTICRRPSWRAEKLRVLPQIGVSAERCAPHCRCDEAGLRAPAFAHDRPAAMSVILTDPVCISSKIFVSLIRLQG